MATEAKGYKPEPGMLCVREDGYLCMANKMAIEQSMTAGSGRLRPYPGKVTDSPDVVQTFLRGSAPKDIAATPLQEAMERGTVNIDMLDRGQLIEYGMDELGLDLTKGKLSAVEMREKIREAGSPRTAPPAAPAPTGIGVAA